MRRPNRPAGPASPPRRRQAGLVLLALLIMLVLIGIAALGAAEVWATTLQREREAELLFIGNQYRRAIASYWKMSPGRRVYPPSVDVLLNDDRFPGTVMHLRRLYRDPMTESGEFEPIKIANGFVGIHSTSQDVPIKKAGFPPVYQQFEKAETYADWKFTFSPTGNGTITQVPNPAVPNQPQQPTPFQGPAPGVALPQVPTGK